MFEQKSFFGVILGDPDVKLLMTKTFLFVGNSVQTSVWLTDFLSTNYNFDLNLGQILKVFL